MKTSDLNQFEYVSLKLHGKIWVAFYLFEWVIFSFFFDSKSAWQAKVLLARRPLFPYLPHKISLQECFFLNNLFMKEHWWSNYSPRAFSSCHWTQNVTTDSSRHWVHLQMPQHSQSLHLHLHGQSRWGRSETKMKGSPFALCHMIETSWPTHSRVV